MSVQIRSALRIILGLTQLGLAVATAVTWSRLGISHGAITLAALTATAVIASLVIFRHER